MLFSPEDLKETEYINPNGQLTEIREGISASPVNISTNADFNSILGSGGATSTPELLGRLVKDLGLDREVSNDKARDTIVRTQFGAHTSVENAFKTAGSAPQVNGATSPQAINTLVRSIAEQAATLQVTGAGLKAQAMSNIESGVVANGGKSLQENRDDFLNQRVNQYRYQLTPAERAAVSTAGAKHPEVQRAQDEYIANNPGTGINDYQAHMLANKPDLVTKDTSWRMMSEESRARMLRSEGKERTVNMYEDDSFLNKMSSGNADQQAEADRFVKMTRESSARADDSYVNQVRRDDTYSEDVSRLQAGKDMTKEGIGLSGLASEINTGTNDIGTSFSKMSDIIRDANVDLKSSFDGISGKGGGGRRSFGGGDDDDDFKKKRDLMTYSQLSYSSMDNIIGNLSYPLMDQALMRPMLAGMASSEIMPGFVSNASGAEEIFNQITGYLPNLGEDIKELEMGQKSLKAVTGSYTASDQMIAHATEIAKAEPIQFGTAVQAFTSFSAFPGTRDEVKGSPQFRESLTDVIQRLAILVPEQGEQGASFALREVMSGQYKSLKQRFNMDLPQLTKAAGEPNMSAAKFENLSGARQINILQKGLKVMTGEDALAERSLTTSVQAGDIKDSLMQSIALKFIQPKESTPLGMSKEESSRMRDVFYERNKRTMGTRLTDQQLYDRTDVQLETAQRSPIGRMAVGMQGMVDVLQTTMTDKGIGSSIEKTITSNIFKPLMEITSRSSGDKSNDVSSSGNKLVEAIETLTRGVKQSSKELVNNPELQKILRSGIDAGVDVMTTTLAPGLGYGMSAGATKAWGAFMNPSNVSTMLGGALSTVSSPTSNWSDSLTTLAPMAMMLQTGLGEGSKKFGFSSKKDYNRVLATPEDSRTPNERTKLRASNFGKTISPQASIQAAVGAAIMAGGIQGMVSNDADLTTRGVSAAMTGIGGFAMLSSFTNTPLGDMWGRNPNLPPPGASGRFKASIMHKGMMGPGLVAGAGAIAVGARYLDEQRRLKELAKGEESFGTQYGGLEETDPALYAKLMGARNDAKSSPKFGVSLGALGAAIGALFGFGLPGASVGAGIGGMTGTMIDSAITGKSQEKLKAATGEADSLISYRSSIDAAYDATRTTALAQTGDTSAIARDLQTSYDISRKGFRGSVDEKMLNLESERESIEAGFNGKSKDGGWREELKLTEDTGEEMSKRSTQVDGKPSLSLEDANKQVMKFETAYGAFVSDPKNKNILSGLDKKEIDILTKAATDDKGKLDFANNKEWTGKAGVAVEDLGKKGISTTADELERFIKLIGTLGVDLGKIQGGKNGKSMLDEVVTNASSTNDKLQENATKQNKLLEEKINTKDAEFFITGKDKIPDFFKTDSESFEGETVYRKKMRTEWTPEEFQSKETAAEKMSFLQKVGEGAQAAKDQYDQKMDYAQKERQSGEGYFTGYTPDIMKEVQSGLQKSLIDLFASSGDKGAQELQGIRKEREARVEGMLQDHADGKPVDKEGLRKELTFLKGSGGSYELRQKALGVLNQGLGDGVANPEDVIDHARSHPGSSKPDVTGGKRYIGNEDQKNKPSAGISEDEKKWLEMTGGKSPSAGEENQGDKSPSASEENQGDKPSAEISKDEKEWRDIVREIRDKNPQNRVEDQKWVMKGELTNDEKAFLEMTGQRPTEDHKWAMKGEQLTDEEKNEKSWLEMTGQRPTDDHKWAMKGELTKNEKKWLEMTGQRPTKYHKWAMKGELTNDEKSWLEMTGQRPVTPRNNEPSAKISVDGKEWKEITPEDEDAPQKNESSDKMSLGGEDWKEWKESVREIGDETSQNKRPSAKISLDGKEWKDITQRIENETSQNGEPSAKISLDGKEWKDVTREIEDKTPQNGEPSAKVSVDGKAWRDITQVSSDGFGSSVENDPLGSAAYINKALALADEGSAILGDSRHKDARAAVVQPQKGDTKTTAPQSYINAYSSTTDRFSPNWKEGQHITPLETERRYDIAGKGLVVDAIDGDTVVAAGARGVTPVRLISDGPDQITNRFGQKRNTTKTKLDSSEILKFKGEDALVQESELGDKLLSNVLRVDTQGDLNMRSLGAARPEDRRRALANLTHDAKTPEQIAALKQVMGLIDHQVVTKAISDGGVSIGRPVDRKLSKGRPLGSLVKSDGSLVTDDLSSGGDSDSSREIRAFDISNPNDKEATERAIKMATGGGEKELLNGENDQPNSNAFKKIEALEKSKTDSGASPWLDIKRPTVSEKQDIYKKAEDKNVEALFGEDGALKDYYTKTDKHGKQTFRADLAQKDSESFRSGKTDFLSKIEKQEEYYDVRTGDTSYTSNNHTKESLEEIQARVAAVLEKTDTEFTQPALSKDVVGEGLDFLPHDPQKDKQSPPWLGRSTAGETTSIGWPEGVTGQALDMPPYTSQLADLPPGVDQSIPVADIREITGTGLSSNVTDTATDDHAGETTSIGWPEGVTGQAPDMSLNTPQLADLPSWVDQSIPVADIREITGTGLSSNVTDTATDDHAGVDTAIDDHGGVKSWWNEKGQARLSEAYADDLKSSQKIGVRGFDDEGNLNEKIDWYRSTGTGIMTDPLEKKGGAELSANQYDSTKVLGPKEFGTSDITDKSSSGPSDSQKSLSDDSGDKDMSKNATMVADTLESLNNGLIKFASSLSGLTGTINNSRKTA